MSLLKIWTPGDLHAIQQQLLADASGVDQTVASCAKLDAPTRASWASFYAGIKDYGAIDYGWFTTTGEAADRAQFLQRELYAWQQKLSATCKLSVPSVDPNKPPGGDDLATALKYGAIAAGFVGSAYIVGKVLDWLPKPPVRRLPATR